jgi:hypothetical protein
MAHHITITDQDYAALADVSARTGTPIDQLVHQAITQQLAPAPLKQSESLRYPTGEPLTPEEREEMERIAQKIGSENPWLSDMVLEDRGPR